MTAASKESLSTLQIGMGWFPHQAGGLNRYFCELLRHLPQAGVEARGLVAGTPGVVFESEGQVRSFVATSAPVPSRLRAARIATSDELGKGRVNLVASHFALYTFPILDLIRIYPLVVHFHGPWASEGRVEKDHWLKTRIKLALERAVYQQGTRFVVLSYAFRDILHRDYRVPLEHIEVIPGGVDVERCATDLTRREARQRLGWPQDRPILLAVRRLLRRMGLEDLVEATKEVRRRVPEVLLLIAGKGTLADELSARIQALGLEHNVRLIGFLPDDELPLAYRAADLTVVPSVAFEGFGLIVVESLVAGTPVLVTPVGGLPEIVRDLSPGLVLPATGVDALAEGLVAILTGELDLPSPQACHNYARALYAWPEIALRVCGAYSKVLR